MTTPRFSQVSVASYFDFEHTSKAGLGLTEARAAMSISMQSGQLTMPLQKTHSTSFGTPDYQSKTFACGS